MDIKVLKDYFEIISFIATTIGMTALFFGWWSYKSSIKHLNFDIINSCTSRFHTILKDLKQNPDSKDNIEAYIGLCNEELFYFKYKYLQKEVVFEWLAGMKDSIPHFVDDVNINKSPKCINHIYKEGDKEIDLMFTYQRLRYTFTFPDIDTYHQLKKNPKNFVKYNYKRLNEWSLY